MPFAKDQRRSVPIKRSTYGFCQNDLGVVLQLPAQPVTTSEAETQKRVAYVG
jgi:hypothetical protein